MLYENYFPSALEANTDEEMEVIPFIPNSDGGQSRLTNEFEILIRLGKGAFGDVIKVELIAWLFQYKIMNFFL